MSLLETFILSSITCIDSFVFCLLIPIKKKKYYFLYPFIFTLFQYLFLFVGLCVGSIIKDSLINYLKYIIFIIFSFMAMKLLIDTLINTEYTKLSITPAFIHILMQAISTSVDSLFLAIPISFLTTDFTCSILFISALTFSTCFLSLFLQRKLKSSRNFFNITGAAILFIFAFKTLI